jgi:DHA1 family tetracycline resistance protein-like MFS transporter
MPIRTAAHNSNTRFGHGRAAFAFIFVTVLLDMLAFGMVIPVLPRLVVDFVGGDTARGAAVYGLFGTIFALMQFVFAPVQGALSDRFGRRPVILASNFGLGIDYLVMANAPSLRWLFVGRVISGITSASFSTAGAYIADVVPPEKRAARFGMLGMAFGIGFVLGPAVGGMLGSLQPRFPFWAAGALSLVNAMYGLFVLPESLPAERRGRFEIKRANPLGALALLRSNPKLFGLATANFLNYVAHDVQPSVFVLYASYRYGWDERTVGLVLALVGISSAVVGGALVHPIVRRFGERRALLAGLFAGALGFAYYGLAPNGTAFASGIPVVAVWGIAFPAAQGLMTRYVDASEQGRLQGAITSLRGIAGLIAPGLFTQTFALAIGRFHDYGAPGAPYLLAGAMIAAAMALAWRVTRDESQPLQGWSDESNTPRARAES